jgi:hypothetical protein
MRQKRHVHALPILTHKGKFRITFSKREFLPNERSDEFCLRG